VIAPQDLPPGAWSVENRASAFVTISATGSVNLGGFQSGGSGDFALLMDDNFFTAATSYAVAFTGLSDGVYSVYLYDPENTFVSTGAGSVNGVAFGSINSSSLLTSFVKTT
jgi:hypothetical protein